MDDSELEGRLAEFSPNIGTAIIRTNECVPSCFSSLSLNVNEAQHVAQARILIRAIQPACTSSALLGPSGENMLLAE